MTVDMGGAAWPLGQPAAGQAATDEPLRVTPVRAVKRPGDVLELGGGDFGVDVLDQGGAVLSRRQVRGGQLRTDGLSPGRYRLLARRGGQSVDAGTFYLEG